jgi:hypothetical protein
MLSLALLLALAASPAAQAGEADIEIKAKRVCRAAAPTIGSHIKRSRVCRTAAEWEEIDNARRGPPITVKPAQPEPWERTRPQ